MFQIKFYILSLIDKKVHYELSNVDFSKKKLSLGVRRLWEGARMKMFIGYLLSKNLIMSQKIYFVCVMHALSWEMKLFLQRFHYAA